MRIQARVEYAIRAMAELALAGDGPVAADALASAQNIPPKFLRGIMTDLKRARLVTSARGPEGGFTLTRPATDISLGDIFRAIDGPLATVRDQSLSDLHYEGAAETLPTVWMAVRATLRRVLDETSLAQLANGDLPKHVQDLAADYQRSVKENRSNANNQ